MSGNNTGGFQPDLFGGQASSYVDKDGNVVTMTQTEADKLKNESRGGTTTIPILRTRLVIPTGTSPTQELLIVSKALLYLPKILMVMQQPVKIVLSRCFKIPSNC